MKQAADLARARTEFATQVEGARQMTHTATEEHRVGLKATRDEMAALSATTRESIAAATAEQKSAREEIGRDLEQAKALARDFAELRAAHDKLRARILISQMDALLAKAANAVGGRKLAHCMEVFRVATELGPEGDDYITMALIEAQQALEDAAFTYNPALLKRFDTYLEHLTSACSDDVEQVRAALHTRPEMAEKSNPRNSPNA